MSEVLNCELCNAEVLRTGKSQRYCPECAKKKIKQRQREESLANKKPLRVQSGLVPDLAPRAWSLKGKDSTQVIVEARALGLSYGQYSAACASGTIERVLADMGIRDGLKRVRKAWKEHVANCRS